MGSIGQFDLEGKILVTVLVMGFTLLSLMAISYTPSIWRGEKRSVSLPSSGSSIDVNVRNYVPFAVFLFGACFIGPLWIWLEMVVGVPLVLKPLFALPVFIGFVSFPLILFVNAFNRPKFLVPPPHRKKRGWVVRLLSGPVESTDVEDTDVEDTTDRGDDSVSKAPSKWMETVSEEETDGVTLEQDITNENVQQWLQRHPKRVDALMAGTRKHETRLLHTDATIRHYAVPDEWWFEIAADLGCDIERTEQDLNAIARTSAFREYAERIGWLPNVRGSRFESTPLVVERNRSETDDNSSS